MSQYEKWIIIFTESNNNDSSKLPFIYAVSTLQRDALKLLRSYKLSTSSTTDLKLIHAQKFKMKFVKK